MPDQPAGKTEQAVLATFNKMVLEDRFDDIRVADLVRESDVGRSTFYDHFRDKHDVLLQSMAGIFGILASVLEPDCDISKVEGILKHFEEHRPATRQMMNSPTMTVITKGLTAEMTRHLPESLTIPAIFVAQQLAEAELSLIRSWVTTASDITASELASAIRQSLQGLRQGYQVTLPHA